MKKTLLIAVLIILCPIITLPLFYNTSEAIMCGSDEPYITDPSGGDASLLNFLLYKDQILEQYPLYYYSNFISDEISYDDFLKECIDEPKVKEFFGPYGTTDAVFIVDIIIFPPEYYDSITNESGVIDDRYETIAEFDFVYQNGQNYSVWKDGSFYSLPEAYNNNVMTHADLQSFYRDHYKTLTVGPVTEPPLSIPDTIPTSTQAGTTATTADAFISGDIDGNGIVDTTDCILIKRHILGISLLTGTAFDAADTDGNGVIDSTDYLLIKRQILGISILDEPIITDMKIKEDFAEYRKKIDPSITKTAENVIISEKYGPYNGAYVMFIGFDYWAYPAMITEKTVSDEIFVYPSYQELTVYKDGEFMTLTEAFDNGVLSDDDITDLVDAYYTKHPSLNIYC